MKIDFEIDDKQVRRLIRRLIDSGKDLSSAMRVVSEHLRAVADEAFERTQSPDGKKWAPLSPVTLARRRGSNSAKPLQDTGRLVNSITASHGKDYAQTGTNVIYAAIQQFGAKKGQFRSSPPVPWGNIPARPFFGLSENHKKEIQDLLRDQIRKATKNIKS